MTALRKLSPVLVFITLLTAACGGDGAADTPPECVAAADCADGDPCTDDLCQAGTCTHPDNTASCDDADPCTTADVCRAGTCAGAALDCAPMSDTCGVAACNPATGTCERAPVDDGTPCNDTNACTVQDACAAGTCRGRPKDCTGFGNACTTGTCSPATGACQSVPSNDGGTCDDANFCTDGDVCHAGQCAGTTLDCTSLDSRCSRGQCSRQTGACEAIAINEGSTCDDHDLCTRTDACLAGRCVGDPVDCSSLDDQCVAGTCDPADGSCVPQPARQGETCDDVDPCTPAGTCTDAICVVETTSSLLTGAVLPGDEGWAIDTNTAALGLIAVSGAVELSTLGQDPGGADGAFAILSRPLMAWPDQGVILTWELRVDTAPQPGQTATAALALFGSFTSGRGEPGDLEQMIVIAETGIAWGDGQETAALDTTGGWHSYRLEVDATGMAMVFFDGELALSRANFALTGMMAFGDQDVRADANSAFAIRNLERVCPGGL